MQYHSSIEESPDTYFKKHLPHGPSLFNPAQLNAIQSPGEAYEDIQEYDYLILDCPPSLGVLTVNALVAVSEVFLPLQPHFLALHGLSKLLRTIEVVSRRLNNSLRLD